MKKACVFYIDSVSDLQDMVSVIRRKSINGKTCVLVRYAVDEVLARTNIRDMCIRAGVFQDVKDIITSNEKSLEDKLKEKGYSCQYYFGINNHIFDKPVSERDIKPSDKSLTFRHACVCNKCESVISETVKQVSVSKIKQLEEQYSKDQDTEINKTTSSLSVIDTSGKCMVC